MKSTLNYNNARPELVYVFIFAMLYAFESLAFGGEFSENKICEKTQITALLKEAENSNLGSHAS